MSKISYKKLSSDDRIYPDNPKYEFPKGISTINEKSRYWYKQIKNDFESFEHHKYSSLFTMYGHDSDNRTMTMPNGAIPMSERYNNMQGDVLEGCQHRIENYLDKQHGGWNIFDKIVGDYEIEIVDNEVIEERLKVLNKFTELLNDDKFLKEIDPTTNERAKTQIDPTTSEERGIEYLFPYGIENTEELHYTVLETPAPKKEKVSKEQIKELIYKCLYEKIIDNEKPANSNILGYILGTYEELKPEAMEIKSNLEKIAKEINAWKILTEYKDLTLSDILKKKGIGADAVGATLKGQIGQSSWASRKKRALGIISNKLKDYQHLGKEIESETSGTYEEVYKTVSIRKIIKRVKDDVRRSILIKNKPPTSKRQGGSNWPKSRGGVYLIRITQNPLDMLTKTTGRSWGSKEGSCENWDGQWLKGPQSDFKYGNCVAWIFDAKRVEENQQIGRAILRWGDSYDELGSMLNRKDIGIEQQLYPKDAPWGLNMFKAIAQIVNDNGFFKYHQLNTPYIYEGYSDYQGKGGTQIQYNRPRFKGKTIELGENELMAMASNVKLAYATAGWLVSNGNEMVKRTLSQNPVIWLYENPIRRLINSSLDLEDGRGLIYDLITSDFADFNFLNTVIDTISIYDPEYDNWGNPENFINVILNHPNSIKNTHESIINNHPGFTEIGTDSKLGTVEELIYLDVLNRANRIDIELNRSLSLAPTTILDSTISKLEKGLLLNDSESIENRWQYAINYNYIEGGYTNNIDKKFYKENREMLYAVNNLLFAPNLSNYSYTILLHIYQKIMDKYCDLVYNKEITSSSLSGRLLETIRVQISISACFPFKTPESWGWKWDEFITENGYDSDLNINIMPPKITNREFKEDRLSYESLPILIKLCPELFKIEDTKYSKFVGLNYLGETSILSNNLLNIYDHIRNKDTMNFLYGTHIRYNLNPLNLLRNPIPEDLPLLIEDVLNASHHDKIDNSKNLLEDKFKLKILSDYIDSSNDYILDNLDLVKYSFLPDKTFFRDLNLWESKIRLTEPKGFIESLLNHKEAPNKCKLLGVDLIGSWLVEEKHFKLFEIILYKAIFGKYYKYKKKKHKFEDLPALSNYEGDWDLYIKEAQMKNEIDITLLTICANGLENQTNGISQNPNIPENLQMKLILPEHDLVSGDKIEAYGITKWSVLSERYGGDYNYYKTSIINKLASNRGASGPCLRYLLKSYYQIMGDKLLKRIAQNPNSHLVGLKDYKKLVDNHPIEILTNENQPHELLKDTFEELLIEINKVVRKDPYETFKSKIGNFEEKKQESGSFINMCFDKKRSDDVLMDRFENIINAKSFVSFGRYYRGGSFDSDFHRHKNSPLSEIRNSPRNSTVKKIKRRASYKKKVGDDEHPLTKHGFTKNWPYGKLDTYIRFPKDAEELGQRVEGISNSPIKLTKPHFIITMNNGSFSKLLKDGWKIMGLPNNPSAGATASSDMDRGIWSKKKLAERWIQTYMKSYCMSGIYYPAKRLTKKQMIDYIEDNYSKDVNSMTEDEWNKYQESDDTEMKELKSKVVQIKDDGYWVGHYLPEIQHIYYSSKNMEKEEIEVFQINEVIKLEEQIIDDSAARLVNRFGVSEEDIGEFLPTWSLENYQFIGRKKRRGGRWVKFTYDLLQYHKAIGYDGYEKLWLKDLVICLVPKLRDKDIPKWRLEMTNAKFKTIVRNYLKNKLINIDDFIDFCNWLDDNRGTSFTSPLGDYNFNFKSLFSIIDDHKLWSKEIVNHSLPKLLDVNNNCWLINFPNIKPTSELLNITMIDNEENLRESKYANYLRLNDIKSLQEWLVNRYQKELPISYIYEIITWPAASEQVKGYARNIRNQRLSEFIDYQRKLQEEMLEGEAEEYILYNSEAFNAEPETSIKELLLQYCELMHPKDLSKRDALMQNIIYGNEYISIERMLNIIKES